MDVGINIHIPASLVMVLETIYSLEYLNMMTLGMLMIVDDGDGEDGLNGTNKKPMGGFGLLVLGRVAGWDTGQVHTVKKLHTVTTHCVWRTKDFLSPLISCYVYTQPKFTAILHWD